MWIISIGKQSFHYVGSIELVVRMKMSGARCIYFPWMKFRKFLHFTSHWGFVPQIWRHRFCTWHQYLWCKNRSCLSDKNAVNMLKPSMFFIRSYSYYLWLLNNLRIAKDFFVANMWGRRVTNCFISWIVLSPWRSSNWADISLAFLLSAGPTALKFLSLDFNDKSLLV